MTIFMKTMTDTRRILIFLAFAYGIAWLTGLYIYLTGGLGSGAQLLPGLPLAVALLAFPYMWAPALANILTRALTREGWKDVGLRPRLGRGWPYWLAGWFLPGVMTLAGAALFFVLFSQYFDAGLTRLGASNLSLPMLAGLSPWASFAVQMLIAAIVSPLLNFVATFGEEFGWRAYLLPKLLPLGWRKAMLLQGLIWGVWHWPVIFMGYEYGFSYPGAPWLGPLLFIWITFCFGTFLAWLVIRGGSVWPAVIGHAAINGIAAGALLATSGQPNPLLGPLPVGVIGSLGYALAAVLLFILFKPPESSEVTAGD
jgi:membrane protease YdiL (CAAX protease family)